MNHWWGFAEDPLDCLDFFPARWEARPLAQKGQGRGNSHPLFSLPCSQLATLLSLSTLECSLHPSLIPTATILVEFKSQYEYCGLSATNLFLLQSANSSQNIALVLCALPKTLSVLPVGKDEGDFLARASGLQKTPLCSMGLAMSSHCTPNRHPDSCFHTSACTN